MGTHEADEILASLILKHDSQVARTGLYDRHCRMATAIAGRFFRSWDVVEDAVNLAFMKAFTRLATWDPGLKSFPAWFAAVVRNTCKDMLRHQKADRDRFRHLKNVRCGYAMPEYPTADACEFHSEHWWDPEVLGSLRAYLEKIGPDRVRFIVNPPAGRLEDRIRAFQTRDRHTIAEPLEISDTGRRLSRRISNELLLATLCGKLPGGLIQ